MLAGDHPSADFAISEQAGFRRFVHLPMGMEIATIRLLDPVAVRQRTRSRLRAPVAITRRRLLKRGSRTFASG
jgi:hypothetical protein